MLFGKLYFSVARLATRSSRVPSFFSLGGREPLRSLGRADPFDIPIFERTSRNLPAEQPSDFSLTVAVICG